MRSGKHNDILPRGPRPPVIGGLSAAEVEAALRRWSTSLFFLERTHDGPAPVDAPLLGGDTVYPPFAAVLDGLTSAGAIEGGTFFLAAWRRTAA